MPLPRPSPGTGRWWLVGILGCAVAVAFVVWFGLASTIGKASVLDIGYHVVDDRSVDVTFQVTRPADRSTTCTVTALDRRFGVVGTLAVSLPPSAAATVARTVRVRTTARAVTGVVQGCTVR